ncbi:hypothetical protein MVEN_01331700 [Mycena venus]|uniref:DUF6533 domain-containing protein n=1 Tax=Mycena venus TaxID=2733690 RepID=A0A8H7CW20_9AGAR|nr:hypothetical protein MVEN_01331700 [Mycena venus]
MTWSDRMGTQEVHAWQLALQGHQNRVSALTVMVWDYVITLEDERELFWKRRPWTLATCLFLWIRYVGILLNAFGVFVAVSPDLTDFVRRPCTPIQAIPGSASKRLSGCQFHGQFKAFILQLRIYALYDASPRIAALIIGAFIVEILVVIGMFGIGSTSLEAVAEAVGNMVCQILLAFLSQTLMKGCAVSNCFLLHDILVRDSVIYYLA